MIMQHIVDFQVTWLVIKTKWLHQNYCVSAYKEHGSWPEASKADVVGQFCQKLHKEVLCSPSLTIKSPTQHILSHKRIHEKNERNIRISLLIQQGKVFRKRTHATMSKMGLKTFESSSSESKKMQTP